MASFYIDPSRESDPNALPDAETFYIDDGDEIRESWTDGEPPESGWYWWPCFPGCLPDGEPIGPFDTEAEAIADARSSL